MTQAGLYHARRRVDSLKGIPELFRTHQFAVPTATITTNDVFTATVRAQPVVFRTKIRILINAGVHRGLIFEFGSLGGESCAAWVQDDGIGFTAEL